MTGSGSDAGLSTWWPTPVRATDHFSADELRRSAELHRPLRRVGRELAATRVLALAGAAVLLGAGPFGDRLDDMGSTGRAVVAATAVVAGLRGSEAIAARRLAQLDGVELVPKETSANGTVGVGASLGRLVGAVRSLGEIVVPIVALGLIARFVLGPLADPTSGWLVAGGLAAAATVITVVTSRVRAGRAVAVDVPEAWTELLDRAGCRGPVTFGLLEPADGLQPLSDSPDDDPGRAGSPAEGSTTGVPNACAIGYGRQRWILVDRTVLDRSLPDRTVPDRSLLDDPDPSSFILAHEVTHLVRRHPEAQTVLYLVMAVAGLASVPAAAGLGWPGGLLEVSPDDPRSLPVVALLVLLGTTVARIPASWALRGLERSADAGAVDLVGVPDRSTVRSLHLRAGGELAPPRWSQLLAVRPSPAERLEYLARCRRSFSPGSMPVGRRHPRPSRSAAGGR